MTEYDQIKERILEQINWLSDKLDERLPTNTAEAIVQRIAILTLGFRLVGDLPNGDRLVEHARGLARGMREAPKKIEVVQ